jgi:hypothetical protein
MDCRAGRRARRPTLWPSPPGQLQRVVSPPPFRVAGSESVAAEVWDSPPSNLATECSLEGVKYGRLPAHIEDDQLPLVVEVR